LAPPFGGRLSHCQSRRSRRRKPGANDALAALGRGLAGVRRSAVLEQGTGIGRTSARQDAHSPRQ
jgi:hypothetical protein